MHNNNNDGHLLFTFCVHTSPPDLCLIIHVTVWANVVPLFCFVFKIQIMINLGKNGGTNRWKLKDGG